MSIFFENWLFVSLIMLIAWLIFLRTKNPGIVDMCWPTVITTSGLLIIFNTPNTSIQLILSGLLLIWGSRLALHLLITRVSLNTPDKRYVTLSKIWRLPPTLGFLLHFQFQGILAIIISSPFYFISQLSHYSLTTVIGALIALLGIIGEAISDRQLHQFKKNHPGKVCNAGLWLISRHPNYFFDWLTWMGFAVAALTLPLGYLSLASPGLLLFLMLKITGPITETASIKSRGKAYLDYQKKTPMFFPKIFKR